MWIPLQGMQSERLPAKILGFTRHDLWQHSVNDCKPCLAPYCNDSFIGIGKMAISQSRTSFYSEFMFAPVTVRNCWPSRCKILWSAEKFSRFNFRLFWQF